MELSHISPPDRLGELQIALEQAKLYEMKIKNFYITNVWCVKQQFLYEY